LAPRDRAKVIIEKCAHPEYKPILMDYYNFSLKKCLQTGSAHEPHMLGKVFKMFTHFEEHGTMRIKNWD
jgi:acetyl-CoA hydrolase